MAAKPNGWQCGSRGYYNFGFRAKCRQAGRTGSNPLLSNGAPPWHAPQPRGFWASGPPPQGGPRGAGSQGGGGGGKAKSKKQALTPEQPAPWLEMSGPQLLAASQALDQ
eukprot:2933783-Pyramimonas_sp.AAC.1